MSSRDPATRGCDTGEITGRIHSLETFALVDGPGVRFAAFLSGCPMRCQYCHNPDTWRAGDEIITARDLWNMASRYQGYWQPRGGVTLSGGEPMLQMPFAQAFFSLAKAHGVHTALDTSGQPYRETPEFLTQFETLMTVTDLVLLDIKAMDNALHTRLTGHTNQNILKMARRLSTMGKQMWIRHVLVPGVTGSDAELYALRAFLDTLSSVSRVEILPYHDMGAGKWAAMGMEYPLAGVRMPSKKEIAEAERILGVRK